MALNSKKKESTDGSWYLSKRLQSTRYINGTCISEISILKFLLLHNEIKSPV